MKERRYERRHSQALFYNAINDRRRQGYDRRENAIAPVIPGTIRVGVGEAKPPVERRRYLDGGMK